MTHKRSITIALMFMTLFIVSCGPSEQKVLQAEDEMPLLQNPVTETYIQNNLASEKPRMVFNDQIVKNVKEKTQTDPVIKNMYKAIRIEAFDILDEPLLERVQEGRRILAVSRNMLHRINTLGVVYLMERDEKMLDRINREVVAVCNFSDWNPPHFLDVAEMSMAVALALDWTAGALPDETIALAKKSIIEKGIYPTWPEHGGRNQWWVTHGNNWNQVCNGSMIAASIAIAEDDPALAAKTIKRSLDGLPYALKMYLPDGVYPEGPGYWAYGTSFSVLTAAILETAFGTDFGHSTYPGFMESAMFKVLCTSPSGLYYNYADCGDKRGAEGDVILAWFASKSGNPLFYEEERFLIPAEDMNLGRIAPPALAWISQYKEAEGITPSNAWYGRGDSPVTVFRNDAEEKQYYFAAKGGSGTISHANLDAGSFIFELDGVRWAIDPGVQPYHELEKAGFDLWSQCQDCERWKLLTKNNFGHSTLTVNGELHNVVGKAEIIAFKEGRNPEATFDLTPVFEGNLEQSIRRFKNLKDRALLITDEIVVNENTKTITWQLITQADVEIADGGAILKQDGKQLKIRNLSHSEIPFEVISLNPPPHQLDKVMENLKRIELHIDLEDYEVQNDKIELKIRLK